MSEHFQNQLKVCGMVPSFAFVRQPEGNGVAERLMLAGINAGLRERDGDPKERALAEAHRRIGGVRQGLLRHSAAVKRTAKEGSRIMEELVETATTQPADLAEPLPNSWRRQVRRRATSPTLLGEAEAAGGEPADAGRAFGAGGA